MARKSKVDYNVYVKWYNKYAKSVEMKDPMLSRGEFFFVYRDAQRAKQSMRDFSRTVAMRQRMASELQTRATWGGFKETLKETKKNVREYEKNVIEDLLRDRINKERKKAGLRKLGKRQILIAIQKEKKKGIPSDIKRAAKEKVAENKQKELTFIKDSENVTWKEFRKAQKKYTKQAREITDTREIWNEAFALAFDSPKESLSA